MLAPMVAHSSDTFLCGHVPPSAFDPKTRQRTTSTQPASWNWAEHQTAREFKESESIVCKLVDGDEVVAAEVRGNDIRSLVCIPRSEHPLNLVLPTRYRCSNRRSGSLASYFSCFGCSRRRSWPWFRRSLYKLPLCASSLCFQSRCRASLLLTAVRVTTASLFSRTG